MRHTAWIVLVLAFCFTLGWGQETTTYVVQHGDSLYSIAKRYGITAKALQQANNQIDPRKLKIGQSLIVPLHLGEAIAPVAPITAANPKPQPISSLPSSPHPPVIPSPSPIPPTTSQVPASPPESSRHYVFLDSVKDIIDTPKVIPGRWRYIVLHHSATPQGSAAAFDVAHRERGMVNGLAYHFVIGNGTLTGDGQIEVGRRWLRQIKGGHLKFDSLNEIAIGICFVGNFDESRPTKKQIAAAIELVSYLREICGPPIPVLMTHTEIHPHHTECPGKYFPTEAFHSLFPGDPDLDELARLRAIPNRGE